MTKKRYTKKFELTKLYNKETPLKKIDKFHIGNIPFYYKNKLNKIIQKEEFINETLNKKNPSYIPNFDINKLYYITETIIKANRTKNDYTILNSIILRDTLKYNYTNYLQILINYKIIESNNYFNTVKFDKTKESISLGFKLVEDELSFSEQIKRYTRQYKYTCIIRKPKINRIEDIKQVNIKFINNSFNNKIHISNIQNNNDLDKSYLNNIISKLNNQTVKLKIYTKKAKKELERLLKEKKININTYNLSLNQIEKINNKDNTKLFDYSNNNRIHSPFIQIKRELRQFIYYTNEGKKTYFDVIDMNTAQLTLLSNILINIKSKFHKIIKKGDIYDFIKKELKKQKTYFITYQREDGQYRSKQFDTKTLNRKIIKQLIFNSLFSAFKTNNSVTKLFKKHFKEIIDGVNNLINKIRIENNVTNMNNGSILALLLQTYESQIFNEITKQALNRNLTVIPLYDGIAYLPHQKVDIFNIVDRVFYEHTNHYKTHNEFNKINIKKILNNSGTDINYYTTIILPEIHTTVNKLINLKKDYIDKKIQLIVRNNSYTKKKLSNLTNYNKKVIKKSIDRIDELMKVSIETRMDNKNYLNFTYNKYSIFYFILKKIESIINDNNLTSTQKQYIIRYILKLKQYFNIKNKRFNIYYNSDLTCLINMFKFYIKNNYKIKKYHINIYITLTYIFFTQLSYIFNKPYFNTC